MNPSRKYSPGVKRDTEKAKRDTENDDRGSAVEDSSKLAIPG
jgi:hypothetical protein